MKLEAVLGLLAICLGGCLVPTQGRSRHIGWPWTSTYGRNFEFVCDGPSFLGFVRSSYSSSYKDRKFNFLCSVLPGADNFDNCKWTTTQNALKNSLFFTCPSNQVITGVKTTYYNNDRTFSFRCCDARGKVLHSCELTGYIGRIQQTSDYRVPHNHVLIGMYSDYYTNFNDRKFRFQVCQIDDDWWF